MRRRIRRLSIALLALAAAAGLFLLIAKFYLASSGGGAKVAARLERMYGAPVRVGGVDVGFRHVTLRHVVLCEAGPDALPWAVIDEVQTDLTPGDLLEENTTPRHLTLVGATVTLRFDRRGSLLTRLPSGGGKTGLADLQDILIRNSRVILKQEGRPDFVVTAVNADLNHDGNRLVASGNATAEPWGDWSLAGYLVLDNGEASLVLNRPEIHFTQPMLDALPFVPANTWQEVRAEGDTPIELTLRYDPATARSHYRIALRPKDGRVRVTAIDLEADQVRGEIVIADGLVQLRNLTGRTAEGTIQTSGDLDFHSTPEQLKFAVDVQNLLLKQLPRSWSLPPLIDGRLTGHADLVVTLTKGKARTNGDGTGIVREARIVGLPALPIRLRLIARGRGFFFVPDIPIKKRRAGAVSPPLPRTTEPDYAEADFGMEDADLAKLLRGLGFSLPVTGRITWKARLTIPLATAQDPKTYHIVGNVVLPWARIEGLELEQVQARIDYRDGVLRLEDLAGQVPGSLEMGRLAGFARFGLIPRQALDGRLTADSVSLGRLLGVLPGLVGNASGVVSGQVEFHAPLPRLGDVTTWNAVGSLASPRARVFDWEVTGGRGNFHLADGVLNGADLAGQVEGVPIAGSGRLRLTTPFIYEARMEIADQGPTAVQRLVQKLEVPIAVSGPFRLTAKLRGILRPLTIHAEGTGAAPELELDGIPLQTVSFGWETNGRRLDVTALQASLFSGECTGDAVIPLIAGMPGRAALAFRDVEAGPLIQKFAAIPARLQGRISGTVQVRVTPSHQIRATLQLQSPRLRVQQVPADHLSGTIAYGPDGIEYRLAGIALDGRLFLEGHVPPTGAKDVPTPPHEGMLRLEGGRLTRLWEAVGLTNVLGPLYGIVDLEVKYHHDLANRMPFGTGRCVLRGLRWDDTELASAMSGSLVLAGTRLRLRDISGDLLRGHAVYDFGKGGRGGFNLNLERVEMPRLLAPWPALRSRLEGPVDVQVRGRLGPDWHGSGEIHLSRGTLLGVEMSNARLPFDFEFAPLERNGRIDVREATGQVARGRVTAQASYRWGGDERLETRLRFFGVQVRALLRSLGADISQFGTGQLSGQLDLGGTNIRSPDDLTATFRASLQQAQAAELPVVRQLLPFLAPGKSGSAVFTNGDLEILLARGILHIERCRLVGPVLQMVIEGTATLTGRLDLDATANTSSPLHAGGAEGLGARVPAVGSIPMRLLAEVTALFAGRLLHLRVTGTWRSPIIHVAPILTLTEEAARFFLGLATRGASIIASPGGF